MDEEDSFFSYICSNFVNHRSLNTPATFHPLSWPRGGSSPSNNSKTRSIISDTHHDRTIFRAGMAGQRYSRHWIGPYLVHGPTVCFVRCCCQPLSPFLATPRFRWSRYGWKSPRLTFVPITPSLINYAAGLRGGAESIIEVAEILLLAIEILLVSSLFCNFYFETVFYIYIYSSVIWFSN